MEKRGWGVGGGGWGSDDPPQLPGRWECILDDIVVKLEKQNLCSKQPQWKRKLVFIYIEYLHIGYTMNGNILLLFLQIKKGW